MGRIVGKPLRGVTIQTGQRDGHGGDAIYRPGPRGRTRLAGGGPAQRRRCGEVLQNLGGWFEVADDETPTRVEFDKALVIGMKQLGDTSNIASLASPSPLTREDERVRESEKQSFMRSSAPFGLGDNHSNRMRIRFSHFTPFSRPSLPSAETIVRSQA